MILGLLTLITALSISAVAIYYSVAGLAAIFAAAVLPIVIMGGTLEVAKLVTAVWLHKHWREATWWLKSYLTTAVLVLMLITSMGIFGFLSKAHIEQTSASQESVAQVDRLTVEIVRQKDIIARAEGQIKRLESSGTGADANIQAQIDAEQQRIDKAYERIQPAIDEQNRIIGSQGKLFQDELDRIDEQLATLQRYIDAGDKDNIRKAQAMIGARQDGSWGSRTAAAAEEWRKGRQQARADLLTKIEAATNNPQARAARAEIQRLRKTVETQIAESNKLINRLRTQIGKTDKVDDINAQVDEQTTRIKNANAEIDTLTEEKYKLQAEYRKLEAEVGPVKYIAEFIYGESADTNMLEEAVRWVIVILIFVFDPLAVLLLIASQYTFEWHRQRKENEKELEAEMASDEWELYEKSRAEKIEENIPPTFTTPEVDISSTDETVQQKEEEVHAEKSEIEESSLEETKDDPVVAPVEESVEPQYEADDGPLTDEQIEQIEESVEDESVEDESEEDIFENASVEEKEAMRQWKKEHPGKTLKGQRKLFRSGKITEYPWEAYLKDADEDVTEAIKWAEEQNLKKKQSVWLEKDGKTQIKKSK